MQRVTLRILAEECGLSKYAVSRALSGKSGVSEATRERVIAAAERLGYQRQSKRHGHVIAAIFEDPAHVNGELHSRTQGGLQREAANLGVQVLFHWLHHGDRIDTLIENCDALALVNVHDRLVLDRVRQSGKPAIYSGWVDPLDPIDSVCGTDHEAGSAVARHLLDLGHREIVYVNGPVHLRGRRERLYGLREIVDLNPACCFHDLVWKEDENFSDALDALLRSGARPTAFFCSYDGLALTVVTELLSRGLSIPADVSVVGFGDYSAARQIRPPLTTVRVPGDEQGRSIIRLLHARLSHESWPGTPVRHQVLNKLILRETTGPARAKDVWFRVGIDGRPTDTRPTAVRRVAGDSGG